MRAAEFTGRILTTGAVEIPAAVWQELRLRPGLQVRIVVLREEDTPAEPERLAKDGEEAWRKVDESREQLSGLAFNATEAVLRARHEEEQPPVIALDSAVVMKSFKSGETHETEALDLRQRIARGEVEAVVSELVPLEVVRGLKGAQGRDPSLGLTDAVIAGVYAALQALIQAGVLRHCPVSGAGTRAKDVILSLGLFTADAVQLATAVVCGATHFVTEDHHFTAPLVRSGAAAMGVTVVDLPEIITVLDAAGGPPSPPAP